MARVHCPGGEKKLTLSEAAGLLSELVTSLSLVSWTIVAGTTNAGVLRRWVATAKGVLSSVGSSSTSPAVLSQYRGQSLKTQRCGTNKYLESTAIFDILSSKSSSLPRVVSEAFSLATGTSAPSTFTLVLPGCDL